MRAEPLTDNHQSTNPANSSAPKLASAQVGSRSTLQLSPFGLISSAERRLNFEQAELTTFQEGADASTPEKELSPTVTWGVAAAKGPRHAMEDAHTAAPNIGNLPDSAQATSFFAVFDGHGGSTAAEFGAEHLLSLVVNHESFAAHPGHALNYAFQELDEMFYKAFQEEIRGKELEAEPLHCSGSTVLAALLQGPQLMIANAGDSRAVISKRGRAEDLSRDHRPVLDSEMERVRSCGGYIEDGYLNGDLTVTRGIGDFHLEALKRKKELHTPFTGPLIAEPEIQIRTLTTEDEFVVLACDGLWDSPGFKGEKGSQRVIELARQNLQQNDNDAQKCAQYLVDLSLQQQATDNLTVLVICLTPEAPPKRDTDLKRSVSQNGFSTLRNALQEADDSSSKVLL